MPETRQSLPAPIRWLADGLGFIGRHGPAGFALSIFLGLALPGLAATMRPFLPACIFCFVALSFARADFGGVARVVGRPAMLALAFLWITLGMPVMIEAGLLVIGREALSPGLLLGIALVAAAPPLMGFPAYAALLRIDNSLGMALLVLSLAVTPLISPSLASFVAGAAVPIQGTTLAVRLFLLLAGAGAAALLLRALAGPARLMNQRQLLDGINVVLYFGFAIAAMDGVIDATLADPGRSFRFLAIGSGLAGLGFVSAQILMRSFGPAQAFVLGLGTGMRNTGLLVAAMGSACPPDTYLFFALLQFPIYCAPLVVSPLARTMVPKELRST